MIVPTPAQTEALRNALWYLGFRCSLKQARDDREAIALIADCLKCSWDEALSISSRPGVIGEYFNGFVAGGGVVDE